MELLVSVLPVAGAVLFVLGFAGSWKLGGQLTREEKVDDTLHRYKLAVNRLNTDALMDLERIRKESHDNDQRPVSGRSN